MKKTKNTVLVTGGTGFIGSHLVKKLVQKKYYVHILVRSNSNLSNILEVAQKVTLHICDLSNKNKLKKTVNKIKPNHVFHLAHSGIMSGVTAESSEVIEGNLGSIVNILDALKDVKYDSFIHSGSFLEYGFKNKPMKENEICEPPELYSITKLASTLYAQSVAKQEDKPIVIFRIFTPYGPNIQVGRLIYNVISNALNGDDILMTKPSTVRDFVYAEDIADLYIEASKKAKKYSGEIFNCGSGSKKTLKQIVDQIVKLTNSKSKIKWNAFPSVSYDSDMWQADMGKTFSSFLWRPKHTLDSGLKKTIDSLI